MIETMTLILYILGSILLVVLIILGIKMILAMNKINEISEDISKKLKSLNGIFTTVDFMSDKISLITTTIVNSVVAFIKKIFKLESEEDNDE